MVDRVEFLVLIFDKEADSWDTPEPDALHRFRVKCTEDELRSLLTNFLRKKFYVEVHWQDVQRGELKHFATELTK